MAGEKFEAPKSVDYQLLDVNGKKNGKVRLAPNRIL